MSDNGVSYIICQSPEMYVNIPFSQHENTNDNEEINTSGAPIYSLGSYCEECKNCKNILREHDCQYNYEHPLRIYSKEYFIKLFDDTRLGINCEKGIYNYTVQDCKNKRVPCLWSNKYFKWIYKHCFVKVKLTMKRFPHIYNSIIDGEMTSQSIAFASAKDINPERWTVNVMKGVFVKQEIVDSMIQCVKCKQNKVHYYQLQTRSADEPMTTFCTCTNCNHRWKF